eukprot:715093-Rhodomonas_salina.6
MAPTGASTGLDGARAKGRISPIPLRRYPLYAPTPRAYWARLYCYAMRGTEAEYAATVQEEYAATRCAVLNEGQAGSRWRRRRRRGGLCS